MTVLKMVLPKHLFGDVTENENNRTLAHRHAAQRIFALHVDC
jgi:hypothetical protein